MTSNINPYKENKGRIENTIKIKVPPNVHMVRNKNILNTYINILLSPVKKQRQ